MNSNTTADLILQNGRITTLDAKYPEAKNLAITNGRIVGVDDAESYQRGPGTKSIDLNGRRVIPGLNDSHLHVIRGGLNYTMELRWDGVPSLADGLRMLKEQAQRTPPGQWVRVVGGWSEFQFAERRMPTLDEINAAAPDTPVFILHLYCRALLNKAATRRTRRIHPAAKSNATRKAIPRACSSRDRTPRFSTRRSPKAQSCRRSIS